MAASRKPDKRATLFAPLRFDLPEQAGLAGVEIFAELDAQLRQFVSAGELPTPRLQQHKQTLLEHVRRGGKLAPKLRVVEDARAALALWREHPAFLARAPLDGAVLDALRRVLADRPPRNLIWQLIQLYLEHYDRLPAYRALAEFLADSFARLPANRENQSLHAYREQRAHLFGADGPGALIAESRRRKLPLLQLARAWALPDTARFTVAACERHYLEPLAALALGAEPPLFAELQQEEVKTRPMPDGLLLGHHAAMRLMDTALAAKRPLPENWRKVLLGILDDPRVPRGSQRFQTWWARLDKKYLLAMRSWLSQLDLKLFLNILEDVAQTHNKTDLLRMFPARKRFLEGLYAQGLIQESRLLLGSRAEKYIREHFETQALPEFGRLNSADVSLIYLNLHGVHFLEGTHWFQVRLYQDLPVPGLADYEERNFHPAAIRKYPADCTVRHSHAKLPRWQRELIEKLGQPPFNLYVDPQQVLSAEDYRAYQDA